jgi:hypothetical protein
MLHAILLFGLIFHEDISKALEVKFFSASPSMLRALYPSESGKRRYFVFNAILLLNRLLDAFNQPA